MCTLCGCGTTKLHTATEQLLMSDAVDIAVAKIDFTPLEGQTVFFDDQYIKDYKGVGFVNSGYVVSSLRQQMVGAGLMLQDKKEDADFVVEARLGTLGSDTSEVVFGIPANNALNAAATAASVVSQSPSLPGIPEISFARRNDELAAAKIGAFAYERETRERVWQSGISIGQSKSRDMWVMGAGPFHKGGIHKDELRFAGEVRDVPILEGDLNSGTPRERYRKHFTFIGQDELQQTKIAHLEVAPEEGKVVPASAEKVETPK